MRNFFIIDFTTDADDNISHCSNDYVNDITESLIESAKTFLESFHDNHMKGNSINVIWFLRRKVMRKAVPTDLS